MHRRGRIYWLTWALLVLGAAATGVASIQDAFFRGAVAAFLAPLALPLYERAGPRGATFLGLLTGILWQLFLAHGYGRLVWSDELRAYAMSRLEIDLSVSAAAFAGAALSAAMVHRDQRFIRAATVGTVLALAMTALPYGLIRSSEAARMGPVEVTWLAPAETFEENGRPWRPKGITRPLLSPADVAFLREGFLVIEVDGENALVDTDGRRLWVVWRKRLHKPAHEDGPVRRVFVASTRSSKEALSAVVALPEPADAACAIELSDAGVKVVAGTAILANAKTVLAFEYESLFQKLVDTYIRRGKTQPTGLHAPAFLCLRTPSGDHEASDDSQAEVWVLRRSAMETPREAEQQPIANTDRFNGTLTISARKPMSAPNKATAK